MWELIIRGWDDEINDYGEIIIITTDPIKAMDGVDEEDLISLRKML
jgi:hypothetical protein